MKKVLCMALALLLLAGNAAWAEGAAILNPNGYDLLEVTDVYTNDDSEIGPDGEEIPHAESLTLQGVFGTVQYPPADAPRDYENDGMEWIGFDPEETVCLTLAPGCEIWMPEDMLNPVENVRVDDLQAWYDAANAQMADYLSEDESSFTFYADFVMNDDGELTKIEYRYFE